MAWAVTAITKVFRDLLLHVSRTRALGSYFFKKELFKSFLPIAFPISSSVTVILKYLNAR